MSDREDIIRLISFILNRASVDDLGYLSNAYERSLKGHRAKSNMDMHKIAGKSELLWAIDFISKKISIDELSVVKEALKRRMETKGRGDSINEMAESTIADLNKQMDMVSAAIYKSTRSLVADMILQYDPFISEEHLKVLLEKWVPDPFNKKKRSSLPPDILLAMVEHFISYSTGLMPEKELKSYPRGWTRKYWDSFPVEIQKLIAAYLQKKIDRDSFWRGIRSELKSTSGNRAEG